jgi:hypothetical protein
MEEAVGEGVVVPVTEVVTDGVVVGVPLTVEV